MVEKAKQIVGT